MLCPRCGYYAEKEENVCPECGEILRQESGFKKEGVEAIRQGKRAREAVRGRPAAPTTAEENRQRRRSGASHATIEMPAIRDTRRETETPVIGLEREEEQEEPGPIFDRRRRSVYDEGADEETAQKYLATHANGSKRRMVNWIKVSILCIIAFLLLIGGGWLFLKKTNAGQRMMARIGMEANSTALWAVGDEMMDQGNVDRAIECFEKAKKQDEAEEVIDVDGLLMLGNAYEAAGRIEDAAALYEEIYTKTPSRTEAYVNHIRILQNRQAEGDLAKAAELMKKAYEQTQDSTFQTQRNDLLPSPPEVNWTAAYYEEKKTLRFTSYQGYDIYFTFNDEAKLPEDGILATPEGVELDEGIYNMRAVCVHGELVSDELRGTYKIIMPSPQTPRATLAPNTYKTSQRVRLKPGLDDEKDTSIVIYYTVDGSIPDSDSPIFNGDPILLPNGWVTLKAIAVNRYRKLSNMLEVKYKIEANPKPKTAFTAEDTVDKLRINQTTQLEFMETYGEGTPAGTVQSDGFETECRRFDYPWGYAVMNLTRKNWVLVEVCFRTTDALNGPRGTQVGDTGQYVVDKFKDMQQVESKSGNRGLYSTNDGTGKIWVQENGEKIIRYRYPIESHWVQLEYLLNTAGNVKQIDLKYIP